MEIKSVINKYGEIEPFQAKRITYKIMEETELDKNEANKIQHNVIHALKNNYDESEISTSTIRSLIIQQLISKGYVEEEKKSRKLGMSVSDFEELVKFGCQDNANIGYNPEMVSKYSYDSIAKEYALLNMPKECSEAHINGYLHHHDLEFFNTRPNCMNYDLRFFARNGLMIDGKGVMGSVAKPAKSLEVLLNHLLQAFMAGATVFSGGQGYVNFNTLLAPFAKGMSYQEIKQAIQGFIYNCNMSLVCRGGQILFSSIALDLSCPEVLKDEPAVSFGGVTNGTYKDYQDEADMIFRAVLEVSDEKDGQGRWHRFPNILFNLRKGDLDEYTGNCKLLHELGANNPTLYYVNCQEIERTVMGALTSDTSVMTDKGFKYPQSLSIGDKVMTYSENGSKEWNEIYNIIPKIAPSKVFKITLDNNYQFKVTDNHKLPTNEGIVKSENLKIGMELYDYLDEPFMPSDDYEAEFLGVFLADGYVRDKSRINGRNSNSIEFHVKNNWKKEKIIELCKKNNYDYEIHDRKDNSYTIYVKNKELRDKCNLCYDLNGIKHFPQWVWHDKNVISNIIKGLMFDGRKGSKYRWDWSCSDLPLVIDVLYALSYIGRQSTIYVDNREGDSGNWRINYRISFGLNYNPKNKTKIKSIELVDNTEMVYDLSIENNHNYVCGLGGIHSENCRTALPMNFTGDYAKDCCNTGNFMYTTINLPLIAYESESLDDFYEMLDYYCEIIYTTLKYRRSEVEKIIYDLHMSDFLIQKDVETGEPLYDLDRSTYTIGFCGLNEAQIELNGLSLGDDDELGYDIVKFINAKKDEFKERDGMRWSVIGSPAESTSFRFGKINKQKYDDITVQGTDDSPYLTNSSHIPVNDEGNIVRHIENSDKFHPLTEGGNLLHIWLGEVWSGAEALWKLNQKILNTNTKFWAYSKVFTYCQECQYTINDNISKCPICGSEDLIVYDRITGYYLPVLSRNENGETKQWNDGKLQEFKDRYRHELNS